MDARTPDDPLVVDLVRRAVSGDAVAFASLYDQFAPRVRRFLRYQLRDDDLAEELVQRTFVRIVEALPRYQPRGLPFGAWVFRIARNAMIDQVRTTHPTVELDAALDRAADTGDPVMAVERADVRAEVRRALDQLPTDQRDVLVWRFFGELSPAETAAVMGRSNGAVRVLQHRALAALRGIMDSTGGAAVILEEGLR